jgi:hypothetical protein
MKNKQKFVVTFLVSCCCLAAMAQNTAIRSAIDARRQQFGLTGNDSYVQGRECIRMDSSYYVGWFMEGAYKLDRSADYIGYKNAIHALRKAFLLINAENESTFRNLFSSQAFYTQKSVLFGDLITIASNLKDAYGNTEQPDSVMWVLNKIQSYNFQKDFFGVHYQKAWTIHRYRYANKKQYDFLGSSVAENEKLALQNCYDGFAHIQANQFENSSWFGEYGAQNDRLLISHYIAIMHSYMKNYDSAEYYYQQLQNGGYISWNNYGGLQAELGKFAKSAEYYARDIFGAGDKRLEEPFYYLPMLSIYAGNTKNAIDMAVEKIKTNGSTPGFGWYNISLARAYLYDGQLDSAAYCLDKAASFKEVHIGTTLTQKQYDFTVELLQLMLAQKKIDQEKFFNPSWWRSPSALWGMSKLQLQKMSIEYVLANMLMTDPERPRLIYDLFCSEGTTTWDEAWLILNDMSPSYFVDFYDDRSKKDVRENVKRYFELFKARIQWNDGDESDAMKGLESLADKTVLDVAKEKLFLARLYEGLCKGYDEQNKKDDYTGFHNLWYDQFPQLMPFAGLPLRMQVNYAGLEDDAVVKAVKDELEDCAIDWVSKDAPTANISFEKKSNRYQVSVSTSNAKGEKRLSNSSIVFSKAAGTGKAIALRLFNVGGAAVLN